MSLAEISFHNIVAILQEKLYFQYYCIICLLLLHCCILQETGILDEMSSYIQVRYMKYSCNARDEIISDLHKSLLEALEYNIVRKKLNSHLKNITFYSKISAKRILLNEKRKFFYKYILNLSSIL